MRKPMKSKPMNDKDADDKKRGGMKGKMKGKKGC